MVESPTTEQKEVGIFTPITINNVTFENRILRSSVGGRMANYDGTVTDVWKNFEKMFAEGGVSGIISTTLNVNRYRQTPLEYPPISEGKYVAPLKKYIAEIKSNGCKYIIQIGDPGYAAQTSLFRERQDALSSSSGFELLYGYTNRRLEMTREEVERTVSDFVDSAGRVQETGADGIEITAAKGYIIHQFLNPGINRRKDDYGGSDDKRFRLLEEIVHGVRERVGNDYLLGIRLSARDYNYLPIQNFVWRFPWVFPLRHHFMGNDLNQTLHYGKRLKKLGVDFLHIVSGYGFISPRVTPGPFPLEEMRIFLNQTQHLSGKAVFRAALTNLFPDFILKPIANIGWREHEGLNLDFASRFKAKVGLPVIANGGFQKRSFIEGALKGGECDMVSMARALIANPDLVERFRKNPKLDLLPDGERCTHCNRCCGRTATSPLGCYEPNRFNGSVQAMQRRIMEYNRPDP